MSDDPLGPPLMECPICGAIGLPERIQAHDCAAFCKRQAIATPPAIAVTNEAHDDV